MKQKNEAEKITDTEINFNFRIKPLEPQAHEGSIMLKQRRLSYLNYLV